MENILVLQKGVLRLKNFSNFSSHAVPYFVSSKVLPINLLYYKLTSLLMLDVHNNSVPSTPSDMFNVLTKCITITHDHHPLVITVSIILEQTNIKIPLRESERKSGIVFQRF